MLLENKYKNTAIPDYNQPIKVNAVPVTFTNQTYKAFVKSQKSQPAGFNIQYIDSLNQKPRFVHLQIADKVAIIEELNAENNSSIKNYLKVKPDARMVTSISMATSPELLQKIIEAENIFLEQEGAKSYVLNLYKNNGFVQRLSFDQAVVFAYKTSSFCWQENERRQLKIVDLVDEHYICPENSYSRAKRAKKDLDYFKF